MTLDQAQLAENTAQAEAFSERLEQAPSIDRYIDSSIDRSMLSRYRENADAAAAALTRVVTIGSGRRFSPEEVKQAKTWLMGYMASNPPRDNHVPQQPPDDHLVRQFLCIAAPDVLRACLVEMHRLRKAAGNTWAWFVTVVMQQIWGIRPEALRRRREEARAARKPAQQATEASLFPPLAATAGAGGGL